MDEWRTMAVFVSALALSYTVLRAFSPRQRRQHRAAQARTVRERARVERDLARWWREQERRGQ